MSQLHETLVHITILPFAPRRAPQSEEETAVRAGLYVAVLALCSA
jgi:hypothetical protein